MPLEKKKGALFRDLSRLELQSKSCVHHWLCCMQYYTSSELYKNEVMNDLKMPMFSYLIGMYQTVLQRATFGF